MELKDKIVSLNEQIKQYNNLEKTLKDTLVVAQSTADEVTLAARDTAQIIIQEAEISAKQLISSADDEVRRIRKEYEHLKKEIFIFKTRYKSFIEAQLITLDEFYSEIETKDVNMDNGGKAEEHEEYSNVELNEDLKDLGA